MIPGPGERDDGPPAGAGPGWGPTAAARAGRAPAVRALALAVGGVLTVGALALTSFATANALVRTSESDTRTLEGRVVRAVIDVDGSVDVHAGAAGRVRIDRRSTFGIIRPDVTTSLEGGVLTVRATCDLALAGLPVICSNDVDVELPEATEVTIDASRTRVSGLSGRVEATSDGGSVELTDLGGPIDARAAGGAVIARGLTGDQLRASVGAGAIELRYRAAPSEVDVSSGAGSIVVELPPGEESYRVEATSGAGSQDIAVATDPTSPRRVRASTGAGNVEVRYGPG